MSLLAPSLLELVEEALKGGRQPIVMGYSLGKAQRVIALLGPTTGGGGSITGLYGHFVPVN